MAVVPYKDSVRRMLKSPMQKTFTFLGVTLILVVVFLMGAIKPTFTTIARLRNQIEIRNDVNTQLQTKLDNIQSLQAIYQEREDELSIIDVFFPADMDYSLVMASFEKVNAKYGFEMESIQILKVEKGTAGVVQYPNMELVKINMSVNGRRSNLRRLVKHYEDMPMISNIRTVQFRPDEDKDEENWIDGNIEMFVYKTI